jgi:hypothetical protein
MLSDQQVNQNFHLIDLFLKIHLRQIWLWSLSESYLPILHLHNCEKAVASVGLESKTPYLSCKRFKLTFTMHLLRIKCTGELSGCKLCKTKSMECVYEPTAPTGRPRKCKLNFSSKFSYTPPFVTHYIHRCSTCNRSKSRQKGFFFSCRS